MKKENYLLITFGVILLGIIFVLAFLALSTSPSTQQQKPTISPPLFLSPTLKANEYSPIYYPPLPEKKLMDTLEHRPQLSDEDILAKRKILSLLPKGERSGILYQSTNVIIDYTQPLDIFQVEILITNIDQAKTEGSTWFTTQGMSQKGLCDLPVQFYINKNVAEKLRGLHISFSPLAPGC